MTDFSSSKPPSGVANSAARRSSETAPLRKLSASDRERSRERLDAARLNVKTTKDDGSRLVQQPKEKVVGLQRERDKLSSSESSSSRDEVAEARRQSRAGESRGSSGVVDGDYERLQKQLQDAKKDSSKAVVAREEAESNLEAEQAKSRALETRLSSAKADLESLQKPGRGMSGEPSSDARVRRLEGQLRDAKQAAQDADDEKDRLRKKLNDSERRARQRVEEADARVEKAHEDSSKLRKELREVKRKVRETEDLEEDLTKAKAKTQKADEKEKK